MDLFNMKKIHFVIWGTGNNARLVIDYLKEIETAINDVNIIIDYFIDSDSNKWIEKYSEYAIKAPEQYFDCKKKPKLIISVAKDDEIREALIRNKIYDYYTVDNLLRKELFFKELMNQGCTVKDVSDDLYQRYIYRSKIQMPIEHNNNKLFVGVVFSEYDNDLKKAKQILDKKSDKKIYKKGIRIGVYYNRLYNGGIERVISYQMHMFIEMGYDVTLFTHEKTENDYVIPKKVDRCVIPFNQACPYIWIEKMYDELEKRGINVFINHAHTVVRTFYLSYCLRYLGIKNILVSHTCKEAIEHIDVGYYERIYETADVLITLSNKDKIYWKNKGINAVYIPNPIKQRLEKREVIHNNIIWVGRIDEKEKHILAVVPVMKRLKIINPDIKLTIIGKADDSNIINELKTQIIKEDLTDTIHFEGYLENLDSIYKQAEVIIMTSYFEGFPMTLVESMSYGIPLVLFKINEIEFLKDSRGYIEVGFDDYDLMARAINEIVQNKELQNKLSSDAIKAINELAKTDISKLWDKIMCGKNYD